MNHNLGATAQPGGQQNQPAGTPQPVQQSATTQPPQLGQLGGSGQQPGTQPAAQPTAGTATAGAPTGTAPRAGTVGAAPRMGQTPPNATSGAAPGGIPGTTPRPGVASSTSPAPGARPAGHTGPGTGVPNPNYRYNAKPPLLGTGLQRDILALLIKIGVIAGIVVALFTFIFGIFQYTSPSMDPHIKSGDLIMYSRFDTAYVAQDLIVLSYRGEMQVRRVVAVEGNTVDFGDGGLIVNGARQQEAGIFTLTNRYESDIDFPLTVPTGHVFVLGDHREGAVDSRIYGTVAVEDTLGKVTSVFRRRGL